jgi:perosamine synthetase
MTTGEGGMITTNDDEDCRNFKASMRSHGEREKYKSILLGHNYRMPEIEAAIGVVQLKKLPKFSGKKKGKRRKTNSKTMRSLKSLQLPKEPKGCRNSWYLYTVRLKDADRKKRNHR